MRIDPTTSAFNAQIEQMLSAGKPWHEFEPAALRQHLLEHPLAPPPPPVESAQTRTIPGPAGEIPIRVLIPPTVRGVYLHIHGGGWVLGSHDAQDARLWARANATGLAVVSVGYRLAPEHPNPAAQQDCEAAAAWLVANALPEFGTHHILLGGESAGGHLVATTLVRMRDNHGYTGFRGALLAYGVFDLRHTPSSRRFGARPLIINTPIMEWFVRYFTGNKNLDDPDVSPLLADLSGLPPAFFYVGTDDPLRDDTLFMAAAYEAAGNETELRVYPGAPHGFDGYPIPVGLEATAAGNHFLGRCLSD